MPVGPPPKGGSGSVAVEGELARQIVEAEGSNEWTLMHRFNKAADLLDQALRVCFPSKGMGRRGKIVIHDVYMH